MLVKIDDRTMVTNVEALKGTAMTDDPEKVSEAIDKLKSDTSDLTAFALSLMKHRLAEFQEGLQHTEELVKRGAGEVSDTVEATREHPLTTIMKAAGTGFLVGWLIKNGTLVTNEEAEMAHHEGEQESMHRLHEKIQSMQSDIAALTNAAGEELQNLAEALRMKCEKTSRAAKEYASDNPLKTGIAAGVAGVALGFILHSIWRRHEGSAH
ncbi:MAG TPA: hypothetical protein VM141_10180 [Planctomycetota bacterium]|nr:hypothetical protein [Planctomycetota bacterium]